jgi:hypothetical protein
MRTTCLRAASISYPAAVESCVVWFLSGGEPESDLGIGSALATTPEPPTEQPARRKIVNFPQPYPAYDDV